jgi:protein-S-isoprenylcysteine O-methyltransferase Ste14
MGILHLLWPGRNFISFPWTLLGMLPIAVGISFNLVADQAFHKAGTTVKPSEQPTVLVTDGLFRFSRNPMYFGFVLLLAGVAVLLGSLTSWLVVPAFGIAMDRGFIAMEERRLEQTFGQAWTEYRKKVRRWL